MAEELRVEYTPLSEVRRWPRNPKMHDLPTLEASVRRFGWAQPLLRDDRTGQLVAGHGRLETLQGLKARGEPPPERITVRADGEWLVPVIRGVAFKDDREAEAFLLADNQLTMLGGWDISGLDAMLQELSLANTDLDGLTATGFDLGDVERINLNARYQPAAQRPPTPRMEERFLVPPFSVLDARQGYWQERKRYWLSLGIKSELGRGANLLKMSDTILGLDEQKRLKSLARTFGQDLMKGEGGLMSKKHLTWPTSNDPEWTDRTKARTGKRQQMHTDPQVISDMGIYDGGTSIFDPVLCELIYRWFSPVAGQVLDPFAGGSVRGIVAALLQRRYAGIDLAQTQVEANRAQAAELCAANLPSWHCGDSRDLDALCPDLEADLIFSCPPYADLEVYSDDPRDLSTLEYGAFLGAYRDIIAKACAKLKHDRFACFVVGDVRDPKGYYRDFVGGTVQAFKAAGLELYNDAVLITQIGSLSIRAAKPFVTSRKLGKTHQNVLVFVKGDPRKAAEACGQIEIDLPEALEPVD